MIKIEIVEIDGMTFTKTYSDNGLKIRKIGTNEIYTETYDVLNFEYEETDELVSAE